MVSDAPSRVIGTVECPVEGCTEQLDIHGRTYTDAESGMVGLSVGPASSALEHMHTHRERRP